MSLRLYNNDCIKVMNILNEKVNIILTSPPYNMTYRKGGNADTGRYDEYVDWKPEDEYVDWTNNIFNTFDKILEKDGVILYNFSYSIENPSLPYKLVYNIEKNTNFKLIDTIFWKKQFGMPFPANGKRLSRIVEFIWVFVRKSEEKTYKNGRKITKVSPNGQNYYNVVYNYIEAKNNDKKSKLNQATFSKDLVKKLLDIYAYDNVKVLDPFVGIGTTIYACDELNYDCIGIEISKKQCDFILEQNDKIILESF